MSQPIGFAMNDTRDPHPLGDFLASHDRWVRARRVRRVVTWTVLGLCAPVIGVAASPDTLPPTVRSWLVAACAGLFAVLAAALLHERRLFRRFERDAGVGEGRSDRER